MNRTPRAAALILSILLVAGSAVAAESEGKGEPDKPRMTSCSMTFDLKSWSAFYKTAKGEGTITCDNGQSARVTLRSKGGGATVGKSEIVGGTGHFSEAKDIGELFGAYVQAEAHAGAVKSAAAQVLTKGEISLAISGKGRGVDLGVSFGKLTIERAK